MTNPTFIAILDLAVDPAHRTTALAQLRRERPSVIAMAGCVDFRTFASSENDSDITVLHEWVDQESFGSYLASEAFTRSGAVLRPLMITAPSSRRFRVEMVESVA